MTDSGNIRFNSFSVKLLCQNIKTLEGQPQQALSDLNSAKQFIEVLANHCQGSCDTPKETRIPTDKAEIFEIENFMSGSECDALIPVITSDLRTGGVTNKGNTDPYIRTSKHYSFRTQTPTQVKICDFLGIHPNYAEPMQGQRYKVGEEFKVHSDYFEASRPKEYDHYARQQGGQRTWTFMVYLSDVESGGETEFPYLNIKIKPVKGKALVWNNLNFDGTNNTFTRHASLPVIQGEKFVITEWFRSHIWEYPATPEPQDVE